MKNKLVSKLLVAALASAMVISLAGCGSKTSDTDTQTDSSAEETTEKSAGDTTADTTSESDTKDTEGVTVTGQSIDVNLNDIEDGIYHACFPGDAVADEDGVLYLTNVEIFTEDNYDIVDMNTLKAGDSIVVNGETIKVESVENKDGKILVNGGLDNGGADFITEEDTNGWRYFGFNDINSYTSHGTGSFKISESVVYTDNADLDNPIEGGYDGLEDAILEGSAFANYTQFNTTVRFEKGEIVEITRSYTP